MKTLVQLIVNATAAGKAMLLAADAAAQKALLGLGNVDNVSILSAPTEEPVASGVLWRNGNALEISSGIPPVVTDQPDDTTAADGATATFTVAATNATSYQWQKQESGAGDWAAISGATSASYTTPTLAFASDNTDKVRCYIVGPGGNVTSNAATLTVTPSGPPAGSAIWLRANDESYSNGANVSQWSDRSGNARHYTTGSNYPTFATAANNGKHCIAFNGTNQGLSRSYSGSGSAYTIGFIVGQDSDAFRNLWQNSINPHLSINSTKTPIIYRGTSVEGPTVLPFTNWMPLIYRVNGTTAEIFLGTTKVKSGAVSSGALAVLGLGNLSGYWWNGKMQEVIAYGSALSDSQMIDLATYMLDQAGRTDTARQIICEGDSLVEGVSPGTPWPTLLQTELGTTNYTVRNQGFGGNTIVSVAGSNGNITAQASGVDAYLTTSRLDAKKQVAVVWAGTNDLYYGRTGAQAHADFKTYCLARQAAGGKVIAVNMIDRAVAGSWSVAQQSAFNALFASEASTYSDAQIDAAATFTDHTNTTYFNGDQVHLTTAANTIIMNAVKAAILAG